MSRQRVVVRAVWWEHGWELHVEGQGVTQCHRLSDAEDVTRDYVALNQGVPAGSFDVTVVLDDDEEKTRDP